MFSYSKNAEKRLPFFPLPSERAYKISHAYAIATRRTLTNTEYLGQNSGGSGAEVLYTSCDHQPACRSALINSPDRRFPYRDLPSCV
jgi:hypothetical protein